MGMFDTILFGFICLLAVYGAMVIVIGVLESIRARPLCSKENVRVVLLVKNSEDTIEEIVRNAFRYEFQARVLSACNLAVVDLGSEDDTLKILEKLSRDYQYMDVYTAEEKEKVFCGIS